MCDLIYVSYVVSGSVNIPIIYIMQSEFVSAMIFSHRGAVQNNKIHF
jgi:hypothetical protein